MQAAKVARESLREWFGDDLAKGLASYLGLRPSLNLSWFDKRFDNMAGYPPNARMKYGVLNLALGFVMLVYGMVLGGWAWLLAWLGLDFVLLGIAYLRHSTVVFGKRPDGTLSLWRRLLFLPLQLYTLLVWHGVRLLAKEDSFNTVAPGLVIGRRLLPGEFPSDMQTVVDLTAEFAEPRAIRTRGDYRSFPMLDATAPDVEQLRAFVATLPETPIYVHCAQGHGRTGLFTLAFLVWRQKVENVEAGIALLAKVRPGALLNA